MFVHLDTLMPTNTMFFLAGETSSNLQRKCAICLQEFCARNSGETFFAILQHPWVISGIEDQSFHRLLSGGKDGFATRAMPGSEGTR